MILIQKYSDKKKKVNFPKKEYVSIPNILLIDSLVKSIADWVL